MLQEGLLFAERYKFIHRLGRGGFAEVWLAEDVATSLQVAVKVYAPGTGLDEAGIKLFTQEFSLVFDLNHTNLLRPTYFDNWERQVYLIMPLCRQGSAFKYITGELRITEEECWKMLHDVSAGLAYLHAKGLIHQDIKPDNILIGDNGQYMITDFGISARVRSTLRATQAQEQSGGTMAYMGPERFSSRPKPLMASDIWSLGAMMFELMTGGNPPFGNFGGGMQKNGAEIPLIEKDFSQELKDIVYKCLSFETWDRPSASSIEEMTYFKLHGQNEVKPPTPAAHTTPSSPSPLTPPSSKKGVPSGKGGGISNKVKIAIAAGIAVLVFVATCGSNDDEEPVVVAETPKMPVVNYDSIAGVHLAKGIQLQEEADSFIAFNKDNILDTFVNVEQLYVRAISEFDKALANADLIDSQVVDKIMARKETTKDSLVFMYGSLKKGAEQLRGLELDEYVNNYEMRSESIRQYVETADTETNE